MLAPQPAPKTLMKTAPQKIDRFQRTVRPWGWYETVSEAPGNKIKRIGVLPGQRISLQKHSQRATGSFARFEFTRFHELTLP